MCGPIPKRQVVDRCIRGAKAAARLYDTMSGGIPIDEAPESLLQTEIARKLIEECHFVTVESSVRWLLDAAGAETRGKIKRNNGGRIDIAVWAASDKPRYLIEVKRTWDSWGICSDAERLQSMLSRGGSFHRGLIVATASAAKRETLERRFSESEQNSGTTILEKSDAIYIDKEDPQSWLWAAAVFEVST